MTEAAKDWLADKGFDPVFGARPLRRAIQRFVENPLSKKIIGGELGAGDEILIDASDGELNFVKSSEAVAATADA